MDEHNAPIDRQIARLNAELKQALDEITRMRGGKDSSKLLDHYFSIGGPRDHSLDFEPESYKDLIQLQQILVNNFGFPISNGNNLDAAAHQFAKILQINNRIHEAKTHLWTVYSMIDQIPDATDSVRTGIYHVLMGEGGVQSANLTDIGTGPGAFYASQIGMLDDAKVIRRPEDLISWAAKNTSEVTLIVISFFPGIGEVLDFMTIIDSDRTVSFGTRMIATTSLVVGLVTFGLSPNWGRAARSADDLVDATRVGLSSLETAEYLRLIAGQTRAADDVFAHAKIMEHLRRLYPNRTFHVEIRPSLPLDGTLVRTGVTFVDENGNVWIRLNGKLPLDRLMLAAEHEAKHFFQALESPFWFNAVRIRGRQWIPGTTYKHFVFEWAAYGVNHQGFDRFRRVALAIWHEGFTSAVTDGIYVIVVGGTTWWFWPSSKE